METHRTVLYIRYGYDIIGCEYSRKLKKPRNAYLERHLMPILTVLGIKLRKHEERQ